MSEIEDAIEGVRRIHESAMAEFIPPDTSFFDNLTEEEMFLLFFVAWSNKRKN